MNGFNPRHAFSHFYDNPTMTSPDIGGRPIWTVSDNNKRPIHMGVLLDQGRVVGARPDDAEARLTLDELTRRLPDAANACAMWDHGLTGHVIVDIESSCPPAERDRLLAGLLPHTVYAEVSRSGRGYHLVIPTPPNLRNFPRAMYKRKLQASDRSVEILLYHWCTFTRTPIPGEIIDAAAAYAADDAPSPAELYADLAIAARDRVANGVTVGDAAALLDAPDDPLVAAVERLVVRDVLADHASRYTKTVSDFDGDDSRYEYSVITALAHSVDRVAPLYVRRAAAKGAPGMHASGAITADQLARWTYLAAVEVLPHRPKHDGDREGVPFLLWRVTTAIATTTTRNGVGTTPAKHPRTITVDYATAQVTPVLNSVQ